MTNTQSLAKNQKIDFLAEHFLYEIAMIIYSADILLKYQVESNNKNLLLDDIRFHTRNLIEFFYPEGKKAYSKASDFFINKEIWKNIRPNINHKELHEKICKQVTHLTYTRMQVTPEEKLWNTLVQYKEILKISDCFLDNLPKEYNSNNLKELSKVIKNRILHYSKI
jgi:hypothetical protein